VNAEQTTNYAKVKAQELQNKLYLAAKEIRSEGFMLCTTSCTEKM
jgi:hypothetical protein